MAVLVIVTGPPGSGKTTVAIHLSNELGLPLLGKDSIKERLAGSLSVEGVDWSRRLGAAAYDLLFDLMATLLESGTSLAVDANLHPEYARERLSALTGQHRIVQVVCHAEAPVLERRVRERFEAGERHPIHHDSERLAAGDLVEAFERDHTIDIPGADIQVDTTDFASVDLGKVLELVREAIAGEPVSPEICTGQSP